MNTILVPTDFSLEALKSTQWALNIARDSYATIILFHAYQAFHSGFQTEVENLRDERRAYEESMAAMAKFIEDLGPNGEDIKLKTTCRKGHLVELVREINHEIPIDLIVMGTEGAYGLKYQFMGTNTYDVAESLPIPLLVVPTASEKFVFNHIAFFTDYNQEDHQTLASLYALFGSEKMNYLFVHIHEKPAPPKDADFKRLAAWSEELRRQTPIEKIDWELVQGKEDIKVVQEVVRQFEIDLLVLTMVERTFFDKLFDKSLSKEIVLQSKTPVFIGR